MSTSFTECTPRVGATGEFTSLLNHISLAIRIINSRVRSAGLAGLLGYTGETNVQGEAVQKLDAFSNEVLINVLERSGHCGVMASEENDEAMCADHHGKYVVLFDPLDGSSNIDTNVGIGTIFAILRRNEPKLARPALSDALRPGREIVCAGYVLYGPLHHLRDVDRPGRARLHARPVDRRVLPLEPRHPRAEPRLVLLDERRKLLALGSRDPELVALDQGREARRRPTPTAARRSRRPTAHATSARSSPTRTAPS